jgi:ribosomal protein L7/L12
MKTSNKELSEEIIEYSLMALQMQGYGMKAIDVAQIIETIDLVRKKKGKFNVEDAAKIAAKYIEQREVEIENQKAQWATYLAEERVAILEQANAMPVSVGVGYVDNETPLTT